MKKEERDRWGFREIDKMRFREKLHRTRGRTLIITCQIVVTWGHVRPRDLYVLTNLGDDPHVQVHHEGGDLARLPVLPQPARDVEQDRLKPS